MVIQRVGLERPVNRDFAEIGTWSWRSNGQLGHGLLKSMVFVGTGFSGWKLGEDGWMVGWLDGGNLVELVGWLELNV